MTERALSPVPDDDEPIEGKVVPTNPYRYKLNGYLRHKLIRDIAAGHSGAVLARKYNLNPGTITYYRKKYRDRIEAIRDKLDDKFVDVTFGTVVARVADMSADMEEINDKMSDSPYLDLDGIKEKRNLSHEIADQIGQLPPRQQVVAAQVEHRVIGFSQDELDELLTGPAREPEIVVPETDE